MTMTALHGGQVLRLALTSCWFNSAILYTKMGSW